MKKKPHINYLVIKLKKYIPSFIWNFLKIGRIGNFFFGLYNMIYTTGWLRSVISGRAVNMNGEPIPWLSYPCVEWLENMPIGSLTEVLEFGGGQSTLYFLRRGATVYCVEPDMKWREEIYKKCTAEEAKRLCFINLVGPEDLNIKCFDFILVDLTPMEIWLKLILEHKLRFHYCIVDNLEITTHKEKNKLLWEFQLKLSEPRVDYIGFAAGNCTQQITSVFKTCYASTYLYKDLKVNLSQYTL